MPSLQPAHAMGRDEPVDSRFTLLGRWVMTRFRGLTQVAILLSEVAVSLPMLRNRSISMVFLRQIYFSGIQSIKIIVPLSIAIGTVIIAQIISLVGADNASLIGKVLFWTIVREVGPLLTAMIIIARSGAAIAAELGTMKIHGEIDYVKAMGISPTAYLVLPRLMGAVFSAFVLTLYFEGGAILGGFLVVSLGWHLPIEQFYQGLYAAINLQQLLMSAFKSLLFGITISTACCVQGLSVERSATMIPQAATKGVMQSLLWVFILDGAITIIPQILIKL